MTTGCPRSIPIGAGCPRGHQDWRGPANRCWWLRLRGIASPDPTRERDERGRARNSRPRDGLGRPLPRGTVGVARIPDDLVLAPGPALTEAQRLLDEGLPFHAHEILEGTWKAAPAAERDLWQGLAQLAVGLTHVLRGNTSGASTLLRRGRGRIVGYEPNPPYDIDVQGLVEWADATLAGLATDLGLPPTVPALRRAPAITSRAAGDAILSADPMAVPDVPALLTELGHLRGERK